MYHYITNDYFDKDSFIKCLNRIGVEGIKTNKGIMFDRELLYKAIRENVGRVPLLISMNLKYIKVDL